MIDGVELQTYSTKMDFDPKDPRGLQAQGYLNMLYGPAGMSGSFGAVSDKAFIVAQGVDDDVLKDLIASAKADVDVLSETAHVKAVSSHLPAHRSAVYYVALDNIVQHRHPLRPRFWRSDQDEGPPEPSAGGSLPGRRKVRLFESTASSQPKRYRASLPPASRLTRRCKRAGEDCRGK